MKLFFQLLQLNRFERFQAENSQKLQNANKFTWLLLFACLGFFAYTMPSEIGGFNPILRASIYAIYFLGALFFVDVFFFAQGLLFREEKLSQAPGHKLLKFGEFFFSRKFYHEVCCPAISDMREEYFQALSEKRIWKACWVNIRGHYSFFSAIGLDRALAFVSFFIKAWRSVN